MPNNAAMIRSLVFIIALSLCSGARAQQPAAPPVDLAALARIQTYLNGLRTLSSKFVQTTSQGSFAEGELILARPGRMKIAYAPPTPIEIYADGIWITYVDHELKEANRVPISATPAEVLLRDRIVFGDRVAVSALTDRNGAWNLHLKEAGEEKSGTLTLVFDKEPLRLAGWSVIDPQQVRTTIRLLDPRFNTTIDLRALVYHAPEWANAPEAD